MNYQNQINNNYYLARYNEILINMQQNMLIENTTSNITVDFIRCIIPFNKSIIYMSENIKYFTTNNEIINISNNIIKSKDNENKIMENILKNTPFFINSERELKTYFRKYFKITNNMLNQIKTIKKTYNLDLNYIYEMIYFYSESLKLYNNVLSKKIDYNLKLLINNIIIYVNNEIYYLKQIEKNIN